jgi:hypothetical protein
MKKNIPVWISIISTLTAAAAIAFAIESTGKQKSTESELAALRDKIGRIQADGPDLINPSGTDGTNDLEQMKKLLARKEAAIAALQAETESSPAETPRIRQSWEERMVRMKEEDPEGYAQMIQRREERQQEMRYNLAERTATFMDLDTSFMSEEERANHELLVGKMARVWELTDRFQDPEAAPDREATRELFELMNEVRPLMDQERTVMFRQLGMDLGQNEEEAGAFASYAEEIISATTLRMPRGLGRRNGQ